MTVNKRIPAHLTERAENTDPQVLRFNWHELSGSLGDLGTFLPLALAMVIFCQMDLGLILVFAGLMNVLSGFLFRQPIPVQPMKAIAAVAITERLVAGDVVAAGLIMGLAVFLLGVCGAADWAGRRIPIAVIRGIQAGIGIKLVLKGITWLRTDQVASLSPSAEALPLIGYDSLLTAGVVAALLVFSTWRRIPLLLPIFLGGFVLLHLADPAAYEDVHLSWPAFGFYWPDSSQWLAGLVKGAIPQSPLTLLNSVVAVCALSAAYYPGQGLRPGRVAVSVGVMNLLCVPLGAIPMCHGAGGLAAQYHFGARTGGSVIMLGLIKIGAGILFGGALLSLLSAYPRSILAVMLIFAGFMLASAASDALRGLSLLVVVSAAVPIVLINTTVGFVVGLFVVITLGLIRPHRRF